jgi:hypothetical protein
LLAACDRRAFAGGCVDTLTSLAARHAAVRYWAVFRSVAGRVLDRRGAACRGARAASVVDSLTLGRRVRQLPIRTEPRLLIADEPLRALGVADAVIHPIWGRSRTRQAQAEADNQHAAQGPWGEALAKARVGRGNLQTLAPASALADVADDATFGPANWLRCDAFDAAAQAKGQRYRAPAGRDTSRQAQTVAAQLGSWQRQRVRLRRTTYAATRSHAMR